MPRALSALREWLELRARVHEERRFHLDQATADFLSFGLSRRAAKRKARSRFGSWRSGRIALREIGGDSAGLAHLIRAHRVSASVWFQPSLLLTSIVLTLLLSPAPGVILGNMIGKSMASVGPALVAWIVILSRALFSLAAHVPAFGKARWLGYAVFGGCLHTLASMMAWALAIQIWTRTLWSTPLTAGLSFCLLFLSYWLAAAAQCGFWRRDLLRRCPICLDRLLLTWTQGESDRVLLSIAVTESVCAHGHGVLVESRWARQFRHERSPLQALIHV
jgi:hypothetical protein